MHHRYLIFAAFLCAHLLSYFFRSTNAVLAEDFRRDLHLGPDELGLMTSLFLGAYAVTQLPLGAALDRWGPRWVIPAMMSLAVIGSLITANAEGFWGLAAGRTLIGLGMSGSLMGALKAFSVWFPPASFAWVSGAFVGLGSLGALVATEPLVWASSTVGWRTVFLVVAAVTTAVILVLPLVVRARPPGQVPVGDQGPPEDEPAQPTPPNAPPAARPASYAAAAASKAAGFRAIFSSPAFRRLAWMNFALTGTMFGFQGLWAGPVLVQGLDLDVFVASRILLTFAVLNSLGFLCSGPLAHRFGLRRVVMGGAIASTALLTALMLAQPDWPVWTLYLVYATLGGALGTSVLAYTHARELFPEMAGRAVSAANLFGIGGGAFIQVALGWVVAGVTLASGAVDPTQPPMIAYRWAVGCIVVLLASGIVAYLPLLRRSRPADVPSNA